MNIKTELVIGLLHFTALQTSLLSAPNSCEQDDLRMRMATFTTADLRDADSSNKLLTTINTPSEMSCLHRCVRDSNCSFTRWDTNSFKCELWLEVDENIIKSKSKVRVKFEENVKTQILNLTVSSLYLKKHMSCLHPLPGEAEITNASQCFPNMSSCGGDVIGSTLQDLELPQENGFCVTKDGSDQNNGVVRLNNADASTTVLQAECLRLCYAYNGATGCEVIWNQMNRGCYVHTYEVARGNGASNHACWILPKLNQSIQVCEHKPSQWINCSSGEFINIVYAMYGRLHNGICSNNPNYTFPNLNCTASKSFEVIFNKCNGRERCEVEASNSWFGDPCVNVRKYLDIKYECLTNTMFWVNLMDKNSSTHVDLKHNINQFLNELTLCAWVKANHNVKHGASIIHYGEGKDQYCDDIAITYYNSSWYEGFSFRILNTDARVNFSLLDGRPHQLCVTWGDSGLWNAYQDGKKVSNGAGLRTGKSIDPNGWLVLGQNINRQKISTGNYKCTLFRSNSLFVGGVSQVYLWNESLDSDLLYSFHSSCIVPEIDKLLFKWNVTNVRLRGSVFTQRCP